MSEQNMLSIIVDEITYQVPAGDNLLATLLKLQKRLPYFCWHPVMGSVGACRQCAVTQYQDENDERGRLVMACTTPVTDGMRVSIQDKSSSEFREQVIGAMMTNHPHDCPVCAEGGECHLQDMTVMTGHSARQYKGQKRTFNNQFLGEFIGHEMNRCITCYRCDRFYSDVAGGSDFSVQGSKNQVYFGRHQDGQLESEFSGNLVEVCPTGVFTNKPFSAHFARKWDLQSAPSICNHCSIGCNTSVGERYGIARRVTNRFKSNINGYFLCDRGRFGIGHVNNENRIKAVKGISQASPLSITALDIAKALTHHKSKKWCAIGSARASLEANYLLADLVGIESFSPGFSEQDMFNAHYHLSLIESEGMCSIEDMESADFALVINQDLTLTAPRAALAIRQAMNKAGVEKAADIGVQYWQENAVKTAKGQDLLPCFHIANARNKLMDVDKQTLLAPDDEIVEVLEATIEFIRSGNCTQSDKQQGLIEGIVDSLALAKRPILVTGWQNTTPLIMQLFNELVGIVKQRVNENVEIAVFAPAANSIGLASLMQNTTPSLQSLLSNDDYQGLIILENELSNLSAEERNELLSNYEHVLVLDHTRNDVSENSHTLIPSAAIAESQGAFVNYQSIVQPFWPAYPVKEPVKDSWKWLIEIGNILFPNKEREKVKDIESLHKYLSNVYEHWVSYSSSVNSRIARETHRVSGRTSKYANQTVHEPKTASSESEYRFSMEGSTKSKNSTNFEPFVWAPGWNSNQSVFQKSGTQHEDVELEVKALASLPEGANSHTEEESKKHFLNRGWYLHEWQSALVPEFKLAQSPDRIHVSAEYAQTQGLIHRCYGVINAGSNDTLIVEVCIDKALSGEHIYGHVSELKPNTEKTILPASFEQVEHYKQQQLSSKKSLQQEKERILKQLKSSDQFVPIHFIKQESSHD